MAVVLQQEGIGKNLGKKVSVRMAVGVNSTSIRAIGRILGELQLTMRKVVILCGGPDWPTSVLTGILGLSVKKMLIGTLPVYFLILPTCAAGAMELKKAESPLYASLAGIIMAVSAACQAVMGIVAVSAVNHEAELHQKEIRAMPDDEEVAKAEHDAAVRAAAMAKAVTWDGMPIGMQKVLQLGAFCMIVCCYILKVREAAVRPFASPSVTGVDRSNSCANALPPLPCRHSSKRRRASRPSPSPTTLPSSSTAPPSTSCCRRARWRSASSPPRSCASSGSARTRRARRSGSSPSTPTSRPSTINSKSFIRQRLMVAHGRGC